MPTCSQSSSEVSDMAKVYAKQIRAGKMRIEDVPPRWREAAYDAYVEMYGEPPLGVS